MRLCLALFLPLTLLAQEATEKKEAKTEDKKTEQAADSAEKVLSGSLDLGARWVGWGGDRNTYKSVVNLGQGVRLLGVDVVYAPTGLKMLDELRLQGNNWGGDPYNTARLEAFKKGLYRYSATYSNIAYFNALPSYADPTLASGVYLNQRSYDTSVRNFENLLEITPGARIIPYLGYSKVSDYGWGVTTLVETQNEYPVRNITRWSQQEVRGGLRLEFRRWHATLEQGGVFFKDDESVYSTAASSGNRATSYFDQWLSLSAGQQAYHVRGSGPYTKVLLTANPWDWLDLSGQFIYNNPKTMANLYQNQTGKLATTDPSLLMFTRGVDIFFGNSQMKRVSGQFSAEMKPARRLRIRQTVSIDRAHENTLQLLQGLYYTGTTVSASNSDVDGGRMEVNRNREQIEAFYDISKRATVRGGYRYEWGRTLFDGGIVTYPGPYEAGQLKRHVGLFGVQAHPIERLSLNFDAEIGNGEKTYFRIGEMDTHRYRARARMTLPKSLYFNLNYSRYENKNPDPSINYDTASQATSAALQWMPDNGKHVTMLADYTRSSLRSDINCLYPLGLFAVESLYRDNAHTGTLMADLKVPFAHSYTGHLSFGGSFTTTSGSRPTSYYQPQGRLQLPLTPKVEFFSEWRYYGLHQPMFLYEGFRSNQFTGGVRFQL